MRVRIRLVRDLAFWETLHFYRLPLDEKLDNVLASQSLQDRKLSYSDPHRDSRALEYIHMSGSTERCNRRSAVMIEA